LAQALAQAYESLKQGGIATAQVGLLISQVKPASGLETEQALGEVSFDDFI
jgi:hypothetical protein